MKQLVLILMLLVSVIVNATTYRVTDYTIKYNDNSMSVTEKVNVPLVIERGVITIGTHHEVFRYWIGERLSYRKDNRGGIHTVSTGVDNLNNNCLIKFNQTKTRLELQIVYSNYTIKYILK